MPYELLDSTTSLAIAGVIVASVVFLAVAVSAIALR